jgi:hypothetical protein
MPDGTDEWHRRQPTSASAAASSRRATNLAEAPACETRQRHYVRDVSCRSHAAGFEYRAPKSMRHTHTTLLLMAGKPIAWVAAQAGRTIAVTERVYFHFLPRHARGGAEALEEMLSPDTSRVSGGSERPRTGRERNFRSASVGRNLRIAAQSE